MQLITQNLEATVTASLEKSTRVKAVVVQLTADQTLEATGSFPVLIKRCISAAKTRKQRQRQRQRPKTISVIRRTLLMHVHYTFLSFLSFFSEQYRQLQEKYESLGHLQKVCENHETEMVQGHAREERQNELRKSLSPCINELEKKLRKLRPGLEKDSNTYCSERKERQWRSHLYARCAHAYR